MERFLAKSNALITELSDTVVRPLMNKIDWNDRLIGITGARGTGKTTLLLQKIKLQHATQNNAIYLSLDDISFADTRISDVAAYYIPLGIEAFYIDEVHKYPEWSREIKNLYDTYKKIRIVFTGSCVTDIHRQNADLSRRAVQYEMPGLSYREFLEFSGIIKLAPISLKEIIASHDKIALEMARQFKPLLHFREYLQYGYYPFYKENIKTYGIRLEQIVKMTLENDLRFIEGFDPANTRKVEQLFYILATNAPFKPNISKLSAKTGINRTTLVQYLHYLEKARLINSLSASGNSISILQKPEKIFLENTNLHYAISPENADRGSMREAFFLNQLKNAGHDVSLPLQGDFFVDDKYNFEIGGKGKTAQPGKPAKNQFVVNDDIEAGALHKIPLWLFGLLY